MTEHEVKSGYVHMSGKSGKKWKRRWLVIIASGYLRCYKDDSLMTEKGMIDTLSSAVAVGDVHPSKKLPSEVPASCAFKITVGKRTTLYACEEEEEARDWITSIAKVRDEAGTRKYPQETYHGTTPAGGPQPHLAPQQREVLATEGQMTIHPAFASHPRWNEAPATTGPPPLPPRPRLRYHSATIGDQQTHQKPQFNRGNSCPLLKQAHQQYPAPTYPLMSREFRAPHQHPQVEHPPLRWNQDPATRGPPVPPLRPLRHYNSAIGDQLMRPTKKKPPLHRGYSQPGNIQPPC